MKRICCVMVLPFVVACVAPQTSKLAGHSFTAVHPVSETVRSPKLDSEVEVEIGQSMISTARRTPNPALKLDAPVVHHGENLGHQFQVTIPAGYLELAGTDSTGRFFKAEKPLDFMVGTVKVPVEGGVYVPNDKSRPSEFYWMSNDRHQPLNDPDPAIGGRVVEDHAQYDNESFRRELVYSGISQNTISILYREFLNDMARPAFSQELRYDMAQGKLIGYKDARFEIVKATNTVIRFKVLKHLE